MNWPALVGLLGVMVVLAAVPSSSAVLVITQSATRGFIHGAATSAGIVVGDLIFVSLALLGMTMLATSLGSVFLAFRIIGALYLIWVGWQLLRSRPVPAALPATGQSPGSCRGSVLVSFTGGLLLTLGDVKAIFFYASLFPAVVDLRALNASSTTAIFVVTALGVGGIKLAYAWTARRLVARLRPMPALARSRQVAGGALMATGTYLLVKH